MPHALLLSPDDQAVSAITGVLEELSVTCERPLDGASAAQRINSRSFDLVLVDCENLPAAKLIFDVCRRGKSGNNPVPIAIVDGRAGLPTAFRLGAELILTKPVAKDQARSTIRTAVSRVRREVQTNENVPQQPASAGVSSAATTSAAPSSVAPSEERAQAAAAAAGSLQLTSFAEPAPSFVSTFVPTAGPSVAPIVASSAAPGIAPAALAATLSASARTTKMHSDVDEIDGASATQKLNAKPASSSAPSLSDSSSLSESTSAAAVSENWKAGRPLRPSDDPVLAELEEKELAESQRKSSGPSKAGRGKAAPAQAAAKSGAPASPSHPHGQHKRRMLVALLMLALAGGGFYAVWTYQPGFRAIAQPQIDRLLALGGMALPPASAPAPIPTKRSTQLAAATTAAPAPGRPAATPGTVVAPPTSGAAATAAPVVGKPEPNKLSETKLSETKPSETKPSDSKKDATVATSSRAELPGESGAIVLSSKGAENRLAYSVAPKYPVEARSGGAEGTVVLKEVVDENGKVEGVRLVEGNALLATAAINAVKQWRYRPYVRDGKAQPFQTVVLVDFQRP
jgi:TonB family protein